MSQSTGRPASDELDEVRELLDKGEWKQALERAESIIAANASSVTGKSVLARATVLKAEAQLKLADYDKLKETCEKAIALSKQVREPLLEAEALRMLGNMAWKKGEFKEALGHLDRALEIAQSNKDLRLEGRVRIDKGMTLSHTGEHTAAERELREAILALEKAGAGNELPRAYNNLGVTILAAKNFERAAQMFAKCKKLAEKAGDQSMAAFGAMNRAECLMELDKCPEALDELNAALPIFERNGNKYSLMAVNNIFGLVYAKMREWSRAEDHMLEARILAQEIPMPLAEAMITADLGRIYKWRGDKNKAMQLFKEAKEILERLGAKTNLQAVLDEMKE